jgi:hypothetical protein
LAALQKSPSPLEKAGDSAQEDRSKLATATIEFEKTMPTNGFGGSVSDVYIKINNEIIHIETKAGNKFFTYVSTSGSNFSKQTYNMLLDVNKIENMKVPLNATLRAGLDDATTFAKQKSEVIKAWTKWNDGAILNNNVIQNKFSAFAKIKLNDQNITFFDKPDRLQSFLIDNNDWFDLIFKNNNL